MTGKAFEKIAEGLEEAIAIARGDAEPAAAHIPTEINVRAIRKACGMSQSDFASAFGFSLTQVRDWEQERSRPIGGSRAYLILIETDPTGVLSILKANAEKRRAA